ncbi:MAG: hypothetical protein JWM99_3687, partial [Verrucomicrobiales bacterium]|nr:hypothetical protein [Verrucomicrobiales bacterium]
MTVIERPVLRNLGLGILIQPWVFVWSPVFMKTRDIGIQGDSGIQRNLARAAEPR